MANRLERKEITIIFKSHYLLFQSHQAPFEQVTTDYELTIFHFDCLSLQIVGDDRNLVSKQTSWAFGTAGIRDKMRLSVVLILHHLSHK